jgi:hypothetical protein
MAERRRLHLGIDYGTSTSKIVIRDLGAPGGEVARVVSYRSGYRFPSSVAIVGDKLFLGCGPEEPELQGAQWFHSVKMRVAGEIKGDMKRYFYGSISEIPGGLSARDLATLTIWWLISEGYRAGRTMVKGANFAVGMTVGIPMSFFMDSDLQREFLWIARAAWRLFRQAGPLESSVILSIPKTVSQLAASFSAVETTQIPAESLRDWIRSEAEAAMWWAFQSPAIRAGTYGKIDIGAGTTNASLFHIFEDHQAGRWIKSGIAFFGAASTPVGMDAVDVLLAKHLGLDASKHVQLRGQENDLMRDGATFRACEGAVDGIILAFRQAWQQVHGKLGGYVGRDPGWRSSPVFVIGGGSLVERLRIAVPIYPFDYSVRLPLASIECPSDFRDERGEPLGANDLLFVLVAYGLSQLGLSIPQVNTPDEVTPLPPMRRQPFIDYEDL